MVLGLARPEVHEVFPKLWSGALHEVPLGGLGKRAAEQLVRAVLSEPDAATMARVVDRADGNAFYLEELIRAVAEGRGDSLPETVVAMAQARLERLEPGVRRVLRAASVLGERFWVSGVTAILGDSEQVESLLDELEEKEVVTRSRGDRFPKEREYVFRHALVRDAAYASLTLNDRSTAHRLAVEWLERVDDNDPLVMADHWEKGGEPRRAVPWILRAAEAALDGGSAVAAMTLAERGIPNADGEALGMLRAIQGVSAGAQTHFEKALPALRDAMTRLAKGGRYWFIATTALAFYNTAAGNASATLELAQAIADLPAIATGGGLYARSAAQVVISLMFAGQPDRARSYLDQLENAAALQTAPEASFVGWLAMAKVYANYWGKAEDLAAVVRNARIAVATFEGTRDPLAVASALLFEATALLSLGRYRELEQAAERGLARAQHVGNSYVARLLEIGRWVSLTKLGRAAEAVGPLGTLACDSTSVVAAQSAGSLARALLLTGDAAGAETAARDMLEKARGMAPLEAGAHAVLGEVLLVRGRADESLAAAD